MLSLHFQEMVAVFVAPCMAC